MTAWHAIRCLAFDFDGTLVDSNPIKRSAYFAALEGVPGSAPVIERTLLENPRDDRYGILRRVRDTLAREGTGSLPTLGELVAAYSSICEAQVIACQEIRGAASALEVLRESHPLYLASATPEDALGRVVAGRGWAWFFRGIYGGPLSKVENLVRIAEREGLDRHEIAYVGDGAVDQDAAREFGCAFVGHATPVPDLAEPLAALMPLAREIEAREIAAREIAARARG